MKPLSKMQITVDAKQTAGLDRVLQLLSALPPEGRRELKNGILVRNKRNAADMAVIHSPGDGIYCVNGSIAMAEPAVRQKLVALATRENASVSE